MAGRPTEDATRPQPGDRITIALIPAARDDLRLLQERTSLSMTDLAEPCDQFVPVPRRADAGRPRPDRPEQLLLGEASLVRFL